MMPGGGRVGECFQGPTTVRYRQSRGLKAPAVVGTSGPAHGHSGLQQGLADRLGIDLELLADADAGASRRVQRDGSFDVLRKQHPPSPGHLVAFEKGQDGGPVNRVLAGQGECRRSGQVGGDELLDLLGREPTLDLSRAVRPNVTAPDSCAVSGGTKDMVEELADGRLDLRIHQIGPCDTALIRHFPCLEGGLNSVPQRPRHSGGRSAGGLSPSRSRQTRGSPSDRGGLRPGPRGL